MVVLNDLMMYLVNCILILVVQDSWIFVDHLRNPDTYPFQNESCRYSWY